MAQTQNQQRSRDIHNPVDRVRVTAGHELLMPLVAGRVQHDDPDCPQVCSVDITTVVEGASQQVSQDAVLGHVGEHVLQIGEAGSQVGQIRPGGEQEDHPHPGDGGKPMAPLAG